MSGRILIVDHAGTGRALDEGALGAVGFDCRHCDGFEAALSQLREALATFGSLEPQGVEGRLELHGF